MGVHHAPGSEAMQMKDDIPKWEMGLIAFLCFIGAVAVGVWLWAGITGNL